MRVVIVDDAVLLREGAARLLERSSSRPRPRARHGKAVFRGMFEHCAAAGVRVTVENAVADGDRAAATITCEFPGGRKVVANSILELAPGPHRPRAGRPVRRSEVRDSRHNTERR
jgi:hypothetical protein